MADMTSKDALIRGMRALEQRGTVVVSSRSKAKAAKLDEKASQEDQADAALDAEAWNTLNHLSRIL